MARTGAAWRQAEVPGYAKSKHFKVLRKTGLVRLLLIGDQNNIGARELPGAEAFPQQAPDDCPIRDQHGEAKQGEDEAGAARNFVGNLERADSTGEEKKNERPCEENGVNLVAKDQEFVGPVPAIDL